MKPAEEWAVRTRSRSDAHDAWGAMLSATHLPWAVTGLSLERSSGFAASVRRRRLADLVLVECTCGPNGGVRGRREIAATDGEYLVMLMTLSGHETVSQGGWQGQLSPGSVVVWDSERPAGFQVQDTLVKRSQVARRWHFTDSSHFSRSFKRHFGLNPSDLGPSSVRTLAR